MDLTFTRVADEAGEPVLGRYFERFWLPVLGPTSVVLLRQLAEALAEGPASFDDADLAARLGIKASVLRATLKRLGGFGLMREAGPGRWAVRTRVLPLEPRQARRLPPALAAQHAEIMGLVRA